MPYLEGARKLIEIEVSDRVYADTRFKQKAIFQSLNHYQNIDNGESSISVTVLVRCHAAIAVPAPVLEEGLEPESDYVPKYEYGEVLTNKGIPDRYVQLIANNDTVVNMLDGTIIAIRQGETNEEWQTLLNSFEEQVMLQGDFFEYLRTNAPILIGQMVENHILNADLMGRFGF